MKLNLLEVTLLSLAAVAVISACETNDDNAINKAQACLDKAASTSDGTSCIRMVNGLNSDKASLIRCSATYLRRGFNKDSFITAFDKLKNPTPSMAPAAQMMDVLAFSGTSSETGNDASTDGTYLMSECGNSKSPGMIYMAMGTQTATIAKALAGTTLAGLQQIASGGSTTSATDIGNAAILAQSSYCAGNSSADPKLCASLNQAVSQGGGDPTAVGQALANLLK